jgi:aminomethyltransferase
MVDFAGWDMPIQYSTITEEHQSVRTAVGLFDISHMGRLVFEGPDALSLIQEVYTNDAASMKVGQIRYGLICNEHGGICDDVLVYRFPAFWLMVVNASNREKILAWIDRHRGARDVQVTDKTFAWGMVAVQGPRACEVVTAYDDIALKLYFKGVKELRYYFGETFSTGEGLTILSRTGYTGEDGLEVIVAASRLRVLCDHLVQAAARVGTQLTPCGLGARDTLRLESAMPLYGHELSEAIDPFEAGLGWAVKMDKGNFVGRAALELRRQERGHWKRVGLELEGKRIAREGAAVLSGTREVGRVTSGTFSPTLNRAIAMAYVEPEKTSPGTVLGVDVRGKPTLGRVVTLPFYRRPR